ncbi:MAG: amino acid transport protein [Candidatus Omnitrophica bacterium]|nr:amino acid transport protein [Candidatus Omnitrophota bacterium]
MTEGIITSVVFGSIGFGAFIYGKKNAEWKPMLLGIVLMVYPYFVRGLVLSCSVGAVLTLLLFVWKD